MVCSLFRFFSVRKKDQRLNALQTWWSGGGQVAECGEREEGGGRLKIEDTCRGKGQGQRTFVVCERTLPIIHNIRPVGLYDIRATYVSIYVCVNFMIVFVHWLSVTCFAVPSFSHQSSARRAQPPQSYFCRYIHSSSFLPSTSRLEVRYVL